MSRRRLWLVCLVAACGHATSGDGGSEPVGDPREPEPEAEGGATESPAMVGGRGGAAGRGERGGNGGSAGTAGATVSADAGAPMQPDASTAPAARGCLPPAQCDGFETGTVGAPPPPPFYVSLDTNVPKNTVTVDDQRAFAGKRSVKIHVSGGPMRTALIALRGGPLFPTEGRAKVYGRMMLWLDALPNTDTHWSNVEGFGYLPDRQGVSARVRYGGQFQRTMANYDTEGTGNLRTDCAKRSPQRKLPTRRWVCYEWMFDADKDEMRLWLDGEPVPELTVEGRGDVCLGNGLGGRWQIPPFRQMGLGWRNYQDMRPLDLWIDEAGVGPDRLGCPAGN